MLSMRELPPSLCARPHWGPWGNPECLHQAALSQHRCAETGLPKQHFLQGTVFPSLLWLLGSSELN